MKKAVIYFFGTVVISMVPLVLADKLFNFNPPFSAGSVLFVIGFVCIGMLIGGIVVYPSPRKYKVIKLE